MLLAMRFRCRSILPMVEMFFVWLINQPGSFAAAVRIMLESSWPSLLAVTFLGIALADRSLAKGASVRSGQAGPGRLGDFCLAVRHPRLRRLSPASPLADPAECPHCHAQAPRDREACAACETSFPAPGLKGIEVFA